MAKVQKSKPSYTIFDMSHWDRFPAQRWIDSVPRQRDGIADDELRPILKELYALFPQPGEPSHIERLVIVNITRRIASHKHPQHTLVFYIDVGDPVVPLLCNGESIDIAAGMAILMPPNMLHAVAHSYSKRPRVSLALRWKQEWKGAQSCRGY